MPKPVDPTTDLRSSFLEAVAEFRADRDDSVPWFVTAIDASVLTDAAAFDACVGRLTEERAEVELAGSGLGAARVSRFSAVQNWGARSSGTWSRRVRWAAKPRYGVVPAAEIPDKAGRQLSRAMVACRAGGRRLWA